MNDIRNVCLLGLGEVGSVLADDLSGHPLTLAAWDHAFDDERGKAARNLAARPQLVQAKDAASAAAGCDLVISAVTAAQDLPAALSILRALGNGAYFLDLNSVAPGTKRRVADTVERAGGRYVEAAVMSPIRPQGIESPMLVGGPHAEAFVPLAMALGFSGMTFFDAQIGKASATKMCRSVVVKGMEALVIESLLTARHYGVEETVIGSLANVIPNEDWETFARFMISRALEHGARRAEEMREVATTVSDAGIESWMSEACVKRQDDAAGYRAALDVDELGAILDRILEHRRTPDT